MIGSSVYLELSETRVRILKGSERKRVFRIDGYANLELKYPLGKSLDDDRNFEIGSQIAGFLKERGLRSRRTTVLLNREGMITRNARVPALERKVLDEFLHAAINEFLPVDLNEYAFDYRIIRSFKDEADNKKYFDLMLAAVPRFMVEQVMQIMKATGMYVRSLDILPNSLFRLFACSDYADVAILDVSHDGSRIAICEEGSLLLYADIPFKDLEENDTDFSTLIEETRGYLNFFAARHQGRQVEALHVVGDLARREELVVSTLGEVLAVPVKTSLDDIFTCRWGKSAGQPSRSISSTLAGNLGMMLRKD